jgi:Protein of unknown function (DUF2442)
MSPTIYQEGSYRFYFNSFVSFEEYPDFHKATEEQIFNFKQVFDQFHWPDLDIDIELDALKYPDRFPLKYRR